MINRQKMHKLTMILIIATMISACSLQPSNNNVTANQTQSSAPEGSIYPGPELTINIPPHIIVPTPVGQLGVVTGTLLKEDNEPYLSELLLGELVYSDNQDAPPLVGYSIETSPRAEYDQTGLFVFKDIAPGIYAIVIWTPISATLLLDDEEQYVQVLVEAQKLTDLGLVYVK
jgi:hypothetical protein